MWSKNQKWFIEFPDQKKKKQTRENEKITKQMNEYQFYVCRQGLVCRHYRHHSMTTCWQLDLFFACFRSCNWCEILFKLNWETNINYTFLWFDVRCCWTHLSRVCSLFFNIQYALSLRLKVSARNKNKMNINAN